jgi:hypothetical protein
MFISNTTELLPEHNTLLDYLPNVQWPQLQITNTSHDLGIISSTLLDMSHVIEDTKKDSQIFSALSDRIYWDLENTKLNFERNSLIEKVETVMVFLNPVISIMAFVGFLYLYMRFQTIATALALVSGKATADAFNDTLNITRARRRKLWIPDFYRDPAPAMATPTIPPFNFSFQNHDIKMSEWIPVDFHDTDWIKGVFIILILFLVYCILKRPVQLLIWCFPKVTRFCRAARPQTVEFTIILVIGNTSGSTSLYIRSIPYLQEHYNFTTTCFVSDLRVQGYFFPYLQLDWHDMKITHKHAPLTFTLPDKLRLSFLQALAVRKITHGEYYALFHTIDNRGNLDIMPIQGSRWEPPAPREPIAVTDLPPPPPQALYIGLPADAPPLYPELPRTHI